MKTSLFLRKIYVQYEPAPGSALSRKAMPIGTFIGFPPSSFVKERATEDGRIIF